MVFSKMKIKDWRKRNIEIRRRFHYYWWRLKKKRISDGFVLVSGLKVDRFTYLYLFYTHNVHIQGNRTVVYDSRISTFTRPAMIDM